MPKMVWSSPEDLVAAPASPQRDEFGPEVASAIADLRARGGFDSPTSPAQADRQRAELRLAQPGVNRRGFLQLTGAAAVYAVVAGCNNPHPDSLVGYAQQPDGITLGEGVWYSTSVRVNGRSRPVIAKAYDGRPIKLEGNPDHPLIQGRSDAQTQAVLLDLYDPDRGGVDPERPTVYRDGPHERTGDTWAALTWSALDQKVAQKLASGRVLLITGPVDGPGTAAFLAELRTAFSGRLTHIAHHPFAEDAAQLARQQALGRSSMPAYHFGKAQVLLALGSDILGGGTTGIIEQVQYGAFRRGVDGEPGQVICFEPTMSQLGACADVRVRVAMDRVAWVGWAIAAEVAKITGTALPPAIVAGLSTQVPALERDLRPVGEVPAIRFAAERLLAAKRAGRSSLVYAGGAVHAHAVDVHAAATWLNQALGNEGVTVVEAQASASSTALARLLPEIASGAFAAVVIAGANPAFDQPGAAAALATAGFVVSLNPTRDETTALAHVHAPGLHDLEAWGDAASHPGFAEIRQPLIHPLWDCRAAEESLIAFAVASLGAGAPTTFSVPRSAVPASGGTVSVVTRKQLWNAGERGLVSWREWLRLHWGSVVRVRSGAAGDADQFWSAVLAKGFVAVRSEETPTVATSDIVAPAAPLAGLHLVCTAARSIGDGSQLNNAWLQELPDPVSKVCWDGWLALSPVDAAAAGISDHDVVAITANGETVRLPALVQDGQHPGTVETFLGWGRRGAGLVADLTADDGHRANAFLLAAGVRRGVPVSLAKTGLRYELAQTQHHHRIEGREVALEDVLELHRADPGAVRRSHKGHAWVAGTDGRPSGRLSIWRSHQTYPGHRWGMAIDLDACTGCAACIVACSVENNVPVVGRDEVRRNREMHWIRIDRYWSAPHLEAEARLDVEALHQPMLCQQCDNAPCEAVCPANATMKSDEGVNLQVYNRCIGTRYCSNNCPYKVRRFNWYQYSSYRAGPRTPGDPQERMVKNLLTEGDLKAVAEVAHHPLQLVLNPEVTVRHRGVMEKCNFCVQRQRVWRDREKSEFSRLPDGVITTACAQACPTAALVWGDLNDETSAVSRTGSEARAFLSMDAELNTRPKIAYLRKLRHRPATAAERHELDHGQETQR
jgi:Fe-S-cluster-containing dehydrogenase component/anaerobic selenocysteine-containing dehydrogenase